MESMALTSLGRQQFEAGDLRAAEASYRKAMAAAQQFIAIGHSDQFSYHAYFLAGQRLASAQANRGKLSRAFVDDLRERCERALSLDPSQRELQDDWLLITLLKAWRLQSLGRDPGPELDAALAFLRTWGREPLPVEFRADRMLLHLLLAERCLERGEDPEPDLARGHERPRPHGLLPAPGLPRGRAELQGPAGGQAGHQDPRPTLADALDRLQPVLAWRPGWTL